MKHAVSDCLWDIKYVFSDMKRDLLLSKGLQLQSARRVIYGEAERI